MKVLVTGGREYKDKTVVYKILDAIHANTPITCLVHGDARGADTLGANWARSRNVVAMAYPAAWDDIKAPGAVIKDGAKGWRYNAIAGRQRNQKMLDIEQPDLVVAFPGGYGTGHMIEISEAAGVEVRKVGL